MLQGDIVRCMTRQYSQLDYNLDVVIEYVKPDGRLKLRGYRHLYNRNNFVLIHRPVQAVPVAPEPERMTLLEELTKKIKGEAGTCSYALEFADGTRRFQIRDACHYRIRHHGTDNYCTSSKDPKGVKPVAVALNVSGHVRALDAEAYKAHVKYILDKSPWSKAFLTRYSDDVMKSGVLMDLTQPYSFVCSAAIALRVGSEYRPSLRIFKDLIDMKYSGNVAFIMSHITQAEKEGKYSLRSQGNGHHVFNTGHVPKQFIEFFNDGKLNYDDGKYEDAIGKVYRIQDVIAPSTGHYALDKQGTIGNLIYTDNKEMIKAIGEGWCQRETVVMDGLLGLCKVANTLARRIK